MLPGGDVASEVKALMALFCHIVLRYFNLEKNLKTVRDDMVSSTHHRTWILANKARTQG